MKSTWIIGELSIIIGTILLTAQVTFCQEISFEKQNMTLVNRMLSEEIDPGTTHISLDRRPGSGLAILDEVAFDKGVITLEILGEDSLGHSFVGLAFNVENDSTYEAVYFRPFNFRSEDAVRRSHSIQYIYHPEFTWRRLRNQDPGEYEAAFESPPAPDKWFDIRIIVKKKWIKVQRASSCLTLLRVKRLSSTSSNKIGLWVGHNSKGSFRNVRIKARR